MTPSTPKLNDPSLPIHKCHVDRQFISASSNETFDVVNPSTGNKISSCAEVSQHDTEKAAPAAAYAAFGALIRIWYDQISKNVKDIAPLISWVLILLQIHKMEGLVGDCGIIVPPNFPAAMITRKIGPAIDTGCTVIAKSPGETTLTANALAELSCRTGIPKAVVNIMSMLKNTTELGKFLTADSRIKKVSFIFIVFEDTLDLDAAVKGAIVSKFPRNGQTCVCANWIYVQKKIDDEVANILAKRMEGVMHGPLIHHAQVEDAIQKGGRLVVGGQRLPDLGPTFSLFPFDTKVGVFTLANDIDMGFAGYFFSRDVSRICRVAEVLEAGMMGVNTGVISDTTSSFDVHKQSGFGKEENKL
ncbi:Aldehyde/histidinol dehydrogenase [Mariannaea sp. PMI_226]|nr:Aldehyde/histidinol dehydrogenase [Mariannaea sp. PMI_226]